MTEDFEIHKTLDGKIFGIKNITHIVRREGDNDVVTFKADISGDIDAGKYYLKVLSNIIISNYK